MPPIPEILRLLSAFALLLLFAHAIGRMFDGWKLPRVIGEILGGLLLGPTCASYVLPIQIGDLFATTGWSKSMMPAMSQFGLILLMYTSGLHLRSLAQQGERKVVAVLAVAGIIVPFLTGILVGQLIDTSVLVGSANHGSAFLLLFGTSIAIASIPVISRIMIDLRIMDTSFARIVIATAVIDDIMLYVVLALTLSLVQSEAGAADAIATLLGVELISQFLPIFHALLTIGLLLTILVSGPLFLRQIFRWQLPILNWDNAAGVQLIFLISVTTASGFLDLNPMFAALASGMVTGRWAQQLGLGPAQSLRRLGQFIFVPLYFALVGFKLDLIHYFDFMFFVWFLVFACIVKGATIYSAARFAGESNSSALNLSAALNARGGPGIVLATVGFEAQIINESFFATLVITAIATSLFAGVWLKHAIRNERTLR